MPYKRYRILVYHPVLGLVESVILLGDDHFNDLVGQKKFFEMNFFWEPLLYNFFFKEPVVIFDFSSTSRSLMGDPKLGTSGNRVPVR